jgi:hypothetical protein
MAKCAKKNEQKIRERAANRSSGRSESDWWEKIQMMEGKERSSASPSNQQPAFCFSWAAAHLSYKYPILSFSLYIYILYYRLHSRCWKYYSITPAGTSFTRDSLSRSPPPSFFFILLFQRCPFGFCSDDDSALEAAVFSTYVTARIYFMSFPHQQAPTTEWHRPAFLFLHPN